MFFDVGYGHLPLEFFGMLGWANNDALLVALLLVLSGERQHFPRLSYCILLSLGDCSRQWCRDGFRARKG